MGNFVSDAELRIPSDLIYLRSVRAFIRELAENLGFCSEKINNIEIATDEILSNAFEHGSEGVSSEIVISCITNEESMKIVVRDQGKENPLDNNWPKVWSNVENSDVQIDTERGHGLLLARLLSDNMRMDPNSAGGIDVHLVWFIKEDNVYCLKNNRLNCEPQICMDSTEK